MRPMSKARPTIRKHVPDITDATRPKADRPETPSQARTWEVTKNLAVEVGGLCHRCASQLAWGHQIGFARVEREPCDICTPIIAAMPRSTSHPSWRTVDGRAGSRHAWMNRNPSAAG